MRQGQNVAAVELIFLFSLLYFHQKEAGNLNFVYRQKLFKCQRGSENSGVCVLHLLLNYKLSTIAKAGTADM